MFTTLPLFWSETEQVGDLRAGAAPHWALERLRRHGEVLAIDTLTAEPGQHGLAEVTLLVMAQPRALSPAENVALDSWVLAGGRLLLFADPMLTEESAYALGDRRRPQDVALLSPILAHWGLRLEFDEDQPGGERLVGVLDWPLPVNLPGRLAAQGRSRDCRLLAGGIAAQCRIGKGKVLILADAALFEANRPDDPEGQRAALDRLVAAASETE